MSDIVTQITKEIFDNTDVIAKMREIKLEELVLAQVREEGGAAAVKAVKAVMAEETKAAAQAAASAKAAEAAAARAAKGPSEWTLALKANSAALAEQHSAINKSKEATGALGAAIGALSPQLGAVIGGLQQFEGVLGAGAGAAEVLGTSMGVIAAAAGPLALIIGVVGYAWHEQAKETEKAADRMKDAKAAADSTRSAMASLGDILYDNTIQQKLLNKEITQSEADQLRAAHSLSKDYVGAFNKQATALAVAQAALTEWDEKNGEAAKHAVFNASTLRKEREGLVAGIADEKAAYDGLADQYTRTQKLQQSNIKLTDDEKDGKKDATDATKAATAAEKERAEALKKIKEDVDKLLKADKDAADAAAKRAATYKTALEGLDKMHDAATRSLEDVTVQIKIDAQAAREKAVQFAAEAQAAATTSDQRKAIAIELKETLDAINQQEVVDVRTAEDAKAKAAEEEAQKEIDAAKAAAKAIQDAQLSAISAVQGGLEGIIGLIGGPVAGAIAGMILNMKDTIASLTEELNNLPNLLKSIPKLITGLVIDIVDKVIPGIISAIPDIIEGLILSLTSPEFINALGKLAILALRMSFDPTFWGKIGIEIFKGVWNAFMVGWKQFTSGAWIDSIKQGATEFIARFGAGLRKHIEDAADMIKTFFTKDFWESIWQGLKDVFKELFTLGGAKTKTFGDSPGTQRAGPQGETVQTSPGDYYTVGRNPADLLANAMASFAPKGSGSMAPQSGNSLNLAYQHRSFDSFFVRHANLSGQTNQFFRQQRGKDARGLWGA